MRSICLVTHWTSDLVVERLMYARQKERGTDRWLLLMFQRGLRVSEASGQKLDEIDTVSGKLNSKAGFGRHQIQ